MIELREVSWAVAGKPIVDGVTAAFTPSSFHVILGPNGAGKSSVLRLATGLLSPTSGAVLFAGRPLAAYSKEALARQRAVLSQHVELAFPLRVEDVVLMGRYPHFGRAPGAVDRRIVREALELVDLWPQRRQGYPTLSGGEQQKVHLARVLAQIWAGDDGDVSARALFLDEPTASLDVHYQIHLLDVARDLVSRGCTVVAILHDLNTALEYGDRFLLLDHGRAVLQCDSGDAIPGEVLERVFRVRARHVDDPAGRRGFWRFSR